MKLQRSELMHLTETLKVLEKEREGDLRMIQRQKDFIDSLGLDSTNNNTSKESLENVINSVSLDEQ